MAISSLLQSWLVPLASAYEVEVPGGGGGGASGFAAFLRETLLETLLLNFVGLLALALFVYSASMLIFAQQDNAISETKQGYIYAMIGCATVGLASFIANGFSPGVGRGDIADVESINLGINNVITYILRILAAAFAANIVLQAFRLISSQGASDDTDRAKKRLVASFVGVAIILTAQAVVAAATGDIGSVMSELVGLTNFLLTFVGAGALIVVVLAGMLLILSVNETLKDKAKQMIKTAVIVLIISAISLAVIKIFISFGSSAP